MNNISTEIVKFDHLIMKVALGCLQINNYFKNFTSISS